MAASGWYPDPGGAPGRFRYWDGRNWSTELTDDPADPPPQATSRSSASRSGAGAGTGVGIAVLVLVVVLVSAVLIIRRTGEASSSGPEPAGATASGWDDSSPLPSPQTRPKAESPDSSATTSDNLPSCTAGAPDKLAPHPTDGRVHGGRLSMMQAPDYGPPAPQYLLSWMVDTQGMDQETEPGWQSIFAVGEVERADGFQTPQEATRSSMLCALTNSWYYDVISRKNIRNESISIDGREGWILTAEIRDGHPDIKADGDQLTFLAVEDGRTDALSMWCGMVPLGDEKRIALDQKVLASLRIDS